MARTRRPHTTPSDTHVHTPRRRQDTIAAVRAAEEQALDERIRQIAREEIRKERHKP